MAEIAKGTGWVVDRDTMLKMLTAKTAINAYTLVEARQLLRKGAVKAKTDVNRALQSPLKEIRAMAPAFQKALTDLTAAEAARDAAAAQIGSGDPKTRAAAAGAFAAAQEKVFALQIIIDEFDRRMAAGEGNLQSARQFSQVEATSLKLVGKTVLEVERTIQFDTITLLTALGDVQACLTDATIEYNRAAREAIVEQYNERIRAIPGQIVTDIKELVTHDLKSIGAPPAMTAEKVIQGESRMVGDSEAKSES